jgi:hypothetical protein
LRQVQGKAGLYCHITTPEVVGKNSRELQTVGWVSLSSVFFLRAEVVDAVFPDEDAFFVSVFTPAFFSTDCFLPACCLRTAFCFGASKRPLFTHARTVNHVVRNFFAACPKLMPSRTAATTCRQKSSLYVGCMRFRVRFLSVPVISPLLRTVLGERGIVVLRNSGVFRRQPLRLALRSPPR